jgi:hypothetical protein
MSFHFVFLLLGVVAIAGTLVSLRREHIRPEYSVSWLAVGVLLSGFALFPEFAGRVSGGLGVDPQVWFVIVAGVLISGLVFGISRVVSRLRDENVLLAQRIAILEFRLQRQPVEGNGVKST